MPSAKNVSPVPSGLHNFVFMVYCEIATGDDGMYGVEESEYSGS